MLHTYARSSVVVVVGIEYYYVDTGVVGAWIIATTCMHKISMSCTYKPLKANIEVHGPAYIFCSEVFLYKAVGQAKPDRCY